MSRSARKSLDQEIQNQAFTATAATKSGVGAAVCPFRDVDVTSVRA